jgi:hypothetical protein
VPHRRRRRRSQGAATLEAVPPPSGARSDDRVADVGEASRHAEEAETEPALPPPTMLDTPFDPAAFAAAAAAARSGE